MSNFGQMQSLYRRVLLWSTVLLILDALVDPADKILHLKVPCFALVILVWALRRGPFRSTIPLKTWIVLLTVVVAIPATWTLYGLIVQNIHSSNDPFATLKSFLFLFLLPVVLDEDIDLSALLIRSCFVVALLTLIITAVGLFSPVLFQWVYAFCIAKQNAIITASRNSLGIGVGQFYYKTSPLMLFAFTYYFPRIFHCWRRAIPALLLSTIYAAALLLSGARANVAMALVIAGIISLILIRKRFGLVPAVLVGGVWVLWMALFVATQFANSAEVSNTIKLEHIHSYEGLFGNHPLTLLWGQGIGSSFYTQGFDGWTNITELSYLEMIRTFGIPITFLFCCGLGLLAYRLYQHGDRLLLIAYLGYLFVCASNPLLISSTGFIALCAVWKEADSPSTSLSAFHLPIGRGALALPIDAPGIQINAGEGELSR